LGFIQIYRDEGGRILNISEGGLSFETFAPIERERLVRFWFSLNLRERIEASGRLAWLDTDRRVGGLQFLELSVKARRHLSAHLGKEPETPAGRTATEEAPGKGRKFLAALAKRSLGEIVPMPRNGDDAEWQEPSASEKEPGGRDRKFLATFAKRSLGEIAPMSRNGDDAEWQEPSATEKEPGGMPGNDSGAERIASQAEARSAQLSLMSLVSLERHVTDGRKQLVRGIALGAVFALAVGGAAGWYFGREYARTDAPVAVSQPPAVNGEAPASSASVGGPVAAGSAAVETAVTPKQVTARQTTPGYSPDNPPKAARSQLSVSAPDGARRAQSAENVQPRGGEAKATKKPMTLQQLWAAVQRGSDKAAVELADHYIQGDGVPVNCDQARVLLLVASEKNNSDAIRKLHDLDKKGCPNQPNQ
jgi:hypothetical protein